MAILSKAARVSLVSTLLLAYIVVLCLGLTEEKRRSLSLAKQSAPGLDFVTVSIKVMSIDTAQGLLHERIMLIPSGRFAIDQATPAVGLELLINSESGKQSVKFRKGERIFPIDFTNLLSGNQNRYPFDRYTADIDFMITVPDHIRDQPVDTEGVEDATAPPTDDLVIGANYLRQSEGVSIREEFAASIPGLQFKGVITPSDENRLMHTTVVMWRANNVMAVSIMVMIVMSGLAFSVMGMVLQVAGSPDEINLLPLSLCITLIFGLPAMRNVQPGVPGVGVLSDYISFIWAEFIVSTSAIFLVWTWISRSRKRPLA